ncbi:MAG TPA: hypothetical protein VIY47_00875 [Ignavibacteriaceae bacterium]
MKKPLLLLLLPALLSGCGISSSIEDNFQNTICKDGVSVREKLGYVVSGELKNSRPWKSENFCEMADNVINEPKEISKSSIEGLCDGVIKQAKSAGSMDILKKTMEAIAELDQQAKISLRILNVCTNPQLKNDEIEEISKGIKISVHSLGSFKVDRNICPGYLMKTETKDPNGSSIGYTLVGLGECKDMQTSNAITYHPEFNLRGPLPGDFFSQILQYDGNIPSSWKYNGSDIRMFK